MVSAVSAPTRLRVPDLLNAVDQAADGVLSGRSDHLLPPGGVPTDDRWYFFDPYGIYGPTECYPTRNDADSDSAETPCARYRVARPRRLARCADAGVRRARRIPLGR